MHVTNDRLLDFRGLLAELQGFLGERVVVESACGGLTGFHESRGRLERSVDLQVALSRPLDEPAQIWLCLADGAGSFALRERAFREARAWSIFDCCGRETRYVLVLIEGGGELVICDEWEPCDECEALGAE